jgi:hypothetical protein
MRRPTVLVSGVALAVGSVIELVEVPEFFPNMGEVASATLVISFCAAMIVGVFLIVFWFARLR